MKLEHVLDLVSQDNTVVGIVLPAFLHDSTGKPISTIFVLGCEEAAHYLYELEIMMKENGYNPDDMDVNISVSLSSEGTSQVFFLPYTSGPRAH